jgi:isopenicillin N synthase-like dioxygenase
MSISTLPIIDLGPMAGADAAATRLVVEQIRAACVQHGFFMLTGHGVPSGLMERVMADSRNLFALDDDAKRAVATATPFGRGYARMGGRNLSGGAHAAVKEEFYLGREPPPGQPGQTPWPADLPRFRETMLDYVEAMHALARRVMSVIALSLNLPEDYFAAFCEQPIASLRLVRYPPEGAEAGAHTDFGALTLLLQDGAGGLQVFDRRTDAWIEATPIPGSFVVNLGDLMERWTNTLYRSTPHRVAHRPGAARISAPFFFSGAADHPVACLPTCLGPGEAPAYAPTTPAAHLTERRLRQGF